MQRQGTAARGSVFSCLRGGTVACLLLFAGGAQAQPLDLPDPLLAPDQTPITTAEQWQDEQRPRIFGLFETEVHGKATLGRPANQTFQIIEQDAGALGGQATLKRVEIRIQDAAKTNTLPIRLLLFTPNGAPAPVRTFLYLNPFLESDTDPTRAMKSERWPVEEAIARGFGIASVYEDDVDPDDPSFANGVHQFFDGGQRAQDSWGTIAAWAWGASRGMDYLETDPAVDARAVAVIGHSRGGKAALWAGASDQRFLLTISNDSGEGGAAISRRNVGEAIADLNNVFPHWFSLNYRKYNGVPETLPVDHHELVALMAPRAVYVASASDDDWADPQGEFLAAVHAAPVFALFGNTGLGTTERPAAGGHVHGDQIAYHLREGVHDLTLFDWDLYMTYFATLSYPAEPMPQGGAGGAAGLGGGPNEPGPGGATGGAGSPSGGAGGVPVAGGGAAAGAAGSAPMLGAMPTTGSSGGCACRAASSGRSRHSSLALALLGVLALGARRRCKTSS
jgi:MYXO-CTERM domain-containing protein